MLQPAFIEIVVMLDLVQDSFQNLLLSRSEGRLSSPSSGASHSLTQECLFAYSLEDCPLLMESPKRTPTSATMRATTSAPP